jgi:signal transduction histidine kinase
MCALTTALMAFVAMTGIAADVPPSAPYTSFAQLASLPQADGASVTVRATLTLNGPVSYVEDSTGGAAVAGLAAQGLRIGDELLITGRAYETAAGLQLRNSRAELLWHGSPMPPLSVTAEDAALGKFAGLLIDVNGELIGTERRNSETSLVLRSGHQEFLAHLNSGEENSLLPHLQEGSVLRLRGVCSLLPVDTRFEGGFAILLRSAEDVTVVAGPPWWSLAHLFELGVVLGSLILLGHITVVQMLKARFRAIMAERARMGHELHDTLAQGFAGLSYQLQATRKIVPPANELLIRRLDLALDMVRHSHSEAHRSIMMLRPQPLEEGADLHSAIEAALVQSTADCNLDARFAASGSVIPLPLMTTDALYRVAQEAIANALRHGRPTLLEVKLDYTRAQVCLSVRDNGTGFEPKAARTHGFGLAGMRERIRALRGNFSIDSAPGSGTLVRAEVHLHRNALMRLLATLRLWQASRWNRMLLQFARRGELGSSRER